MAETVKEMLLKSVEETPTAKLLTPAEEIKGSKEVWVEVKFPYEHELLRKLPPGVFYWDFETPAEELREYFLYKREPITSHYAIYPPWLSWEVSKVDLERRMVSAPLFPPKNLKEVIQALTPPDAVRVVERIAEELGKSFEEAFFDMVRDFSTGNIAKPGFPPGSIPPALPFEVHGMETGIGKRPIDGFNRAKWKKPLPGARIKAEFWISYYTSPWWRLAHGTYARENYEKAQEILEKMLKELAEKYG